ncbi:MAG: type II CAAX prenyl endopeptidase Rce1 family protein [Promethearchaeota archaeon]
MTYTETIREKSSKNEIIISPTKELEPSDGSFLQFVLITFAFSWLIWLPGSFFSLNLGETLYSINAFIIIGSFGPFIASFYLTYKQSGQYGVIALWKSGWHCEKKIFLIISIVLIPVICGLALYISSFNERISISTYLTGYRSQYGYLALEIVAIYFFGGPFQEEFGWRGFALKKLQTRWNALESSIILGGIWSVWHFPLFFIPGTLYYNQSFFSFTTSVLGLSIIFTWIYNNSNGSILASMLFHTSVNTTQVLFLQKFSFWSTFYFVIILDIVMLLILGIYGKEELRWSKNRVKIYTNLFRHKY